MMDNNRLRSIVDRMNDLLYLMETTLPSWVCAGEIMKELYGVSDSLKDLIDEED